MTLGEYLKLNAKLNIIDFRIRAHVDAQGDVEFYIHPQGRDGLTLDFVILGSHVLPDPKKSPQQSDIERLIQAAAQGQSL